MLALAAPAVLGFLSRQQASQALSGAGLASLLVSQKDSIARLLPPGVGSALGFAGPSSVAAAAGSRVRAGNRWVWPAVVVAAVALSAIILSRGCGREAATIQNTLAKVQLPNGSSLDLPPNSFNYNLATFLAKGSASELPKTFVFDNLNFVSGSTGLTPESISTVTALAAILKAYPNAAVELAGYTDNTGDPQANNKLSLDRANSVRDQLLAAGIDTTRLTAVGYGRDRPVTSNDTDEGRARNRRLELVVTKN